MKVVVLYHDHPAGAGFDPNPDETAKHDVELRSLPTDGSLAVVGWRGGGMRAAALAASEGARVDRLVLCCVPIPTDGALDFDPATITAKTLLLFGQLDPDAPSRHAKWWKEQIRGARVEMVPHSGSEIIGTMWKRVLSHAAPHTSR